MEEGERAEMAAGVERRFSVDPAIAQKARGKQLHAAAPSGEEASSFVSADGGRPPASIVSLQVPWKAALRSMMNVHFSLYLSSVVVVGIGAGNVFAFLFWTLQVGERSRVRAFNIHRAYARVVCRIWAARRFFSAYAR